mgnify:CR=1 FL=1
MLAQQPGLVITPDQPVVLDADALSMIEGVLQVSETQVRDVMIPRSQMDMIDVAESPEKFIPFVIEKAHSRFPVF